MQTAHSSETFDQMKKNKIYHPVRKKSVALRRLKRSEKITIPYTTEQVNPLRCSQSALNSSMTNKWFKLIVSLFISISKGFRSKISSLWLISIQKFPYNYNNITCIWQKATWISISITYGVHRYNNKYLTTIIFFKPLPAKEPFLARHWSQSAHLHVAIDHLQNINEISKRIMNTQFL